MATTNTHSTSTSPLPLEPKCLWTPTNLQQTEMTRFRECINQKFHLQLENYQQLYDWSCKEITSFWATVWEHVGIQASEMYTRVLDDQVEGKHVTMDEKIPLWFPGAKLNYAENLLRFRDDRIAIIATGEFGEEYQWTHQDLYEQVSKCAGALRALGIQKGDRVAAYIPNCKEAIAIMLAAASLGAVWSSTSPDFGTAGILDRFVQIKPTILVSVNAVKYNGKVYDHLAKVKMVVDGLPTLRKVVVIPFIQQHSMDLQPLLGDKGIPYNQFLELHDGRPLVFEQLPFHHPLFILYSSGTTGKPKCIVHSAGGTLLQHLKEHKIHGDVGRDDVFFQYTTTGWMMWNWLVGALSTGCTIVLFDGSPFQPTQWTLWDLAEKHHFTKFGTSAKYIQSMQEMNMKPIEKYKLPRLNEIYSTGSPLTPESYDFVYTCIKKDLCLASITGGTDIISLFAGHNHTVPVYRGEIQSRCLGMAVESWAGERKPVHGESGDLVCTQPFPCMPAFFWDDPEGKKYKDAYFGQYKGVWYHGDYIWINPRTKGVIMLGRSDGTLKPAGVRFGSAELYNILEKYAGEIADSLAVGQRRPQDNDERVVLFLKMVPGKEFTKELVDKIKMHIRKELSPRHVPAFVLPIADIPYTINGKKVEVAVKKIVSGQKVEPSATVANPECFALFENIPELK